MDMPEDASDGQTGQVQANPELQETQAVEQVSLPQVQPRGSAGRHILAYVSLAAVIVALVGIISLMFLQSPPSSKPQQFRAFLSTYNPDIQTSLLRYYKVSTENFSYAQGACAYEEYAKAYDQFGIGVSSPPPIDFSSFNQSLPIFYYFRIAQINSSNRTQIDNDFNLRVGYLCGSIVPLIMTNATVKSLIGQLGNVTIYTYLFTNFTDAAFNLTDSQYVGARPNLYWYHAEAIRGNIVLGFSVWGFAPYENITAFNDTRNAFINTFVSEFGSNK